jgi:hypothetical protein
VRRIQVKIWFQNRRSKYKKILKHLTIDVSATSAQASSSMAAAQSGRCSTISMSASGSVESQFDRLLSNVANAVQVNGDTTVGQHFSSPFLSSFGRSSAICPPPSHPSPLQLSAFASSSSSSLLTGAPSLSTLHFPSLRPIKRSPSTSATTTSRSCVDTRGSPPNLRHHYDNHHIVHHQQQLLLLQQQRTAADESLTSPGHGGTTSASETAGLDSDATSPGSGGDSLLPVPPPPPQRSLDGANSWPDSMSASVDTTGDRRKPEPATMLTSPASSMFCDVYPTRGSIVMTPAGFDNVSISDGTTAAADFDALTTSRGSAVEYQPPGWCNVASLLDPYATFT